MNCPAAVGKLPRRARQCQVRSLRSCLLDKEQVHCRKKVGNIHFFATKLGPLQPGPRVYDFAYTCIKCYNCTQLYILTYMHIRLHSIQYRQLLKEPPQTYYSYPVCQRLLRCSPMLLMPHQPMASLVPRLPPPARNYCVTFKLALARIFVRVRV